MSRGACRRVAVLMFRFDNPDALLTLVLVARPTRSRADASHHTWIAAIVGANSGAAVQLARRAGDGNRRLQRH
jgi:hypothetical protein